MQYLIPKMKALFDYLDHYQPTGMTPFESERSLVSIQRLDPKLDFLSADAVPWDAELPPLAFSLYRETYTSNIQIMYVEGEMKQQIEDFLIQTSTNQFTEDGKQYEVQMRILLPHETVQYFGN